MQEELALWQARRRAELNAPDSWLGMAGLFWLQPGKNRVGCSEDCVVCLPEGPAYLGDLIWLGAHLFWQPADGEAREIQTDLLGAPSLIDYRNWSFFVVDREGRLAARLRDRDWAAKRPVAELSYFPFDPAWVVDADWETLSPSLSMEVPNVSGDLKRVEVKHRAVFSVNGESVSLLPMSVGDSEVFFVFRDRTSGRETYGAGRFLKADPVPEMPQGAGGGKIRLDFNKAYNPPCAFTPFATCPLPPPENWLPFSIAAGERKWGG